MISIHFPCLFAKTSLCSSFCNVQNIVMWSLWSYLLLYLMRFAFGHKQSVGLWSLTDVFLLWWVQRLVENNLPFIPFHLCSLWPWCHLPLRLCYSITALDGVALCLGYSLASFQFESFSMPVFHYFLSVRVPHHNHLLLSHLCAIYSLFHFDRVIQGVFLSQDFCNTFI